MPPVGFVLLWPLGLFWEMGINNIHHLLFQRLFLLLDLQQWAPFFRCSVTTCIICWVAHTISQLLCAHRVVLNHVRDNSGRGRTCALSLNYASESSKLWWMTLSERLIYSAKSLARHREYRRAVFDLLMSQGKAMPQDTQAKTNKGMCPYLQTYDYVQLLAKALQRDMQARK